MIKFAVRMTDEAEDKGYWVLEIDSERERLLIAQEDGKLRWVNTTDCFLLKIVNPEAPQPMIAMQPQKPIILDANRFQGANGGRR